MSKSTEIVIVQNEEFPVLFADGGELSRAIEENFGPEGVRPTDLDRIGIPPGGATSWEIPTLTGGESTKSLDGIVLHWTRPRTFWRVGIDEGGGGNPPDCFSDDGDVGNGEFGPSSEENPSGNCATCPMDQWGSAAGESRGKACRESRLIYLLRPGAVLPMIVSLPVTSIQPLRTYFLHLASAAKSYYEVVTRLELERQQSNGMTWSTVVPSVVSYLTPEQVGPVRSFAETLKKDSGQHVE